jgi:hypothetical protein
MPLNLIPQHVTTSSIGHLLGSMDLLVGIDMVRCRFRFTAKVEQSLEDWSRVSAIGRDRATLESRVTIPVNDQCSLRLGLREGLREALREGLIERPKGYYALLEVNPSRIVDPSGTRAVGTGAAVGAVEEICPLLEEWIVWDVQPKNWDLYRLDLTVDVETPGITQQVLAVAQRGLRSPRQKVNTYQAPSGDLETVRVNRKTKPNLSIYDKAKQSRTGPPRVRFEVQLNRAYLRDNIPTLGHLTERTARISFQHQMKPVINALKGDKRRLDDLKLDRAGMKTLRELGGHEWLRARGYNDTPTKSEQKRYRDFENKYDISWVGDLF